MLSISVIIATRNRALYLFKAIESVLLQTFNDYELLIVDNDSKDNTKEIVDNFISINSKVKYFYEPVIGLSKARNYGIEEAKGEVIVFLDDDAVADPQWLEAHWQAYQEDPNVVAVGGRIFLDWQSIRPVWLSSSLDNRLGKFDLGRCMRQMTDNEYPFGGNMSFPRQLLKGIGGFSRFLGMKGKLLLGNEEKDLFIRIRKTNPIGKIFYSPQALIYHAVLDEKLNKSYFIQRIMGQGISDVRVRERSQGYRASSFRCLFRAFDMWIKSLAWFIKFVCLSISEKQKAGCFYNKMQAAYCWAYGKEYFILMFRRGLKN